MPKPVIYGASLGLFAGVLIGTVAGSMIVEEVIAQMVFGLIGGLGIGLCYQILTREKREGETFLPTPVAKAEDIEERDSETQASESSIAVWLIPLISIIAALIKGFVVGAKLGQ